jgi:hypothetical protein
MDQFTKSVAARAAANGAGGARRWLGAAVAAVGLTVGIAGPAQANIVANGGFETGDFTGWTEVGNTVFNGVQCPGAGLVPEGFCDAFFGPIGSTGGIAQTLATLPGRYYNIDFDFQPDGGAPSSFSAMFGGDTLVSLTDPAGGPFQHFHFNTLATGAGTTIQFDFRDDPGFLSLDDVRVSVPEPGTLALLGIGMTGLWWRRRKVQ